jgi:hypothetical protein
MADKNNFFMLSIIAIVAIVAIIVLVVGNNHKVALNNEDLAGQASITTSNAQPWCTMRGCRSNADCLSPCQCHFDSFGRGQCGQVFAVD